MQSGEGASTPRDHSLAHPVTAVAAVVAGSRHSALFGGWPLATGLICLSERCYGQGRKQHVTRTKPARPRG